MDNQFFKSFAFVILVLITTWNSYAQNPKIVMHLQSSDTTVHRSVANQIKTIKSEIPTAEVALICHGPGITFLLKEKGNYAAQVNTMKLSGVSLLGCENTMKQRNLKKEDLVPYAQTVPFAIVDIIKKQSEDWLYVKVGF